jgi:predicted permease
MNFLLIAICLIAGFIVRSSGILPANSHRGINAWILYMALPAVTLLNVPAIQWDRAMILPMIMPLIVWIGAWLYLSLFTRHCDLDKGTQAALLLTAGLGNTSFAGFPLTQAYFGDEGLRIAVICDQLNFIVFCTFGMMAAQNGSDRTDSGIRTMVRNIVRFPSFLAFIAALILPRFISLAMFDPLLTKLASTLVPLALFSVGMQIQFSDWRCEFPSLTLGLAYKLLLAPALVMGAAMAFQLKGIIAQTSVFEAAMAPMVTSAILASEYRLNSRLANLMISVGILLSIVTTGFWWFILRAVL